jgi:hypothetical protein
VEDIKACFLDYAHVSRTIWLNFTQETKKCFKLHEYELKLIFEASMMKPSSRRLKWIYEMHDLELGRGSYDILKMF